ncbi:metal-dependent hydrolase [Aquirhabdus sp.]|uniref:metal-dependent hydrolase n=1 Tax=Aquirhabdus sp. TaxID=2824160 RepID=UPI00396CA3FA
MGQLIRSTHIITPRRPIFDFGETPLHWIADDPLSTHILNVLNPITPAPERWFCKTFRDALPWVEDNDLRAAAIAFIKQEGAHSNGHTIGNRRIEALGIDLSSYLNLLDWIFDRMLGSDPLGRKLTSPQAKLAWLKTRLAMVAAAEHLTGVLGHWVLNSQALEKAPIDPEMLRLYQWHGAEEVEHREVADAMFRHISGNIPLRTGAALFIFPLFGLLAYGGVHYLVQQDPQLPYRFRIRDYLRAARQDRVPKIGYLMRAGLRYLAPNHSPLNEGSTEQALNYLSSMPKP